MKISSYLENDRRGTPDFPVQLYVVDENHPQYRMQFHWHSDIEIIHISAGHLHLKLNDTEYTLRPGESILIPGEVVHGATPENCIYECIVFSKSILYAAPKLKHMIKSQLRYPVRFQNNPAVDALFAVLTDRPEEHFSFMSQLFGIVGEALQKQDSAQAFSEEKIERIKPAIVFIEDNYHTHITIEDLARRCFMSNNYFTKYFKEVTAQTPIDFLNKFRVEAACEMLLSGHTVTETAFACGFNDLSYFIHIFKKEMGLSPKKYAGIKKETATAVS